MGRAVNQGRVLARGCGFLFALLLGFCGNAWGLVVGTGDNADIISSSPLITVRHCWTGGDVYDVDVTMVVPDDWSTVTLAFSDVEMGTKGLHKIDGLRVSNMFRLGYDKDSSFAAARFVMDKGTSCSLLCGRIVIYPGTTHRFLMKFRLPPLKLVNGVGAVANPADVPQTVSLFIDLDWYGGCREDAVIIKSYPFCNRALLIKSGTSAS